MQDPEEEMTEYDMPPISTENESYKKKIDEKQQCTKMNQECMKKIMNNKYKKFNQFL